MAFDSAFCNSETIGNLFVTFPLDDQRKHLPFAWTKFAFRVSSIQHFRDEGWQKLLPVLHLPDSLQDDLMRHSLDDIAFHSGLEGLVNMRIPSLIVPIQTEPQPASLTVGSGNLVLTSAPTVETPDFHDDRLQRAIDRAILRIEFVAGLPHGRTKAQPETKLIVRVASQDESVQSIDENESYSLRVTPAAIEIDAPTDVGAMHGLETLLQLLQPEGDGYVLPAVFIQDSPRFRWRGLMVDCGRHFEPLSAIKRTLDGMAAVKLNVFHWHLADDQGFRMESKVFPQLTAKGSDGLFYTQEQAREIVAYAHDRGIRVVPEFDLPGHSTALLVAYPELGSGTRPDGIRREFGVSPYAIDPTQEETYVFLEAFLREMAGIFPDAYVHIGGDETPAPDWKSNPRIVSFMRQHQLSNNEALQAYFNLRVLTILTRLHKRMTGWDEVLAPGLAKDVVIQSWHGTASLINGAKQGYEGVLSAPYYLDRMEPASALYLADPLGSESVLTRKEQKLVLGGEACMWGEQVDSRTIDSRIWPRTAAIAERLWSPQGVRDVNDMYRRLEAVSIELEGLGLTQIKSEDGSLRELAGTEQIRALRIFAAVLEPVAFHDRAGIQHTNQLTALDNLVDAVRPDPPSKHDIQMLVKQFLANPSAANVAGGKLDSLFELIASTMPEVKRQMLGSPRLNLASARADQLTGLAGSARGAIHYLSLGQRAPRGWKAEQRLLVNQAKEPNALVRFTFLDPLSDLVNAVAE